MITAITAFTVSAGGHGILSASVSTLGSDHHLVEHDSGLTNDNLAAAHSEETQCHSANTQVFLAVTSGNAQVVLTETVRMYIAKESTPTWQPIALSPRGKIPLFELANIHTTTLAQRV